MCEHCDPECYCYLDCRDYQASSDHFEHRASKQQRRLESNRKSCGLCWAQSLRAGGPCACSCIGGQRRTWPHRTRWHRRWHCWQQLHWSCSQWKLAGGKRACSVDQGSKVVDCRVLVVPESIRGVAKLSCELRLQVRGDGEQSQRGDETLVLHSVQWLESEVLDLSG